MSQNEKFKDVKIGDRTFHIKKFDALTGSFTLFKVIGVMAPLVDKFKNIDFGKLMEAQDVSEVNLKDFDIAGMMTAVGSISEDDFKYLQSTALGVCYESLPAALTPVINKDGKFGVIGLEDDTATVLALTVHSLMFNVKGFFSGSPLASMLPGLLTSFQRGS